MVRTVFLIGVTSRIRNELPFLPVTSTTTTPTALLVSEERIRCPTSRVSASRSTRTSTARTASTVSATCSTTSITTSTIHDDLQQLDDSVETVVNTVHGFTAEPVRRIESEESCADVGESSTDSFTATEQCIEQALVDMPNSTDSSSCNLETSRTEDTLGNSSTEIERFTEQTLASTCLTLTEFLAIDVNKTVLNVFRRHEYLLVCVVDRLMDVRRPLKPFTTGEEHTLLLLATSQEWLAIDFSLAVHIDVRFLLTTTNSEESFGNNLAYTKRSTEDSLLYSEESLNTDDSSTT